MQTKYVVVLGSLLSGIGKGIVTSSIAKLLSMYSYRAMPLKFDGYLNYDCGTMNPFRHGEVFVLDDGSEVDMDFGTYERFLNSDLNASFSMTGGKVFSEIISRERRGDYLGNDVQIIPHVTDYIVEKIQAISDKEKLDVMLIEVGGTVGDIENNYFVEAMRQLALKRKVVFVDLTYVPELEKVGEQKTKPTQMALRSMRQEGISPDFIVCRSDKPLNDKAKRKIALFSNLAPERVMDDHDLGNIYWLPLHLMKQGFDKMLIKELGLEMNSLDEGKLNAWKNIVDTRTRPKRPLTISVVGKYVDLHDSYASVKEALSHAALAHDVELTINWVESETLEESSIGNGLEALKGSDGILVPGGFGGRGIEGMIKAIEYARTNKIPYLGLCLGMQLMAIEYARNVCNIKDANSTEFADCENKIIDIMEEQKKVTMKGATMRLGAWEARLKPSTIAYSSYGAETVSERHRHRYEFNNGYRERLERDGLIVSGTTPDGNLVEFIEWSGSFGIGTQAHPEFKSRPESPAPLFKSFIKSALNKKAGISGEKYSYTLSASA
ncbi:MAG: CTP synthase [Candidatus Micrarchaeales archaeon]|nr:CTP synthase [Candidatus Micrarchaeales archaeon]